MVTKASSTFVCLLQESDAKGDEQKSARIPTIIKEET